MPCYRPIAGWFSKRVNKATGKRSVVFRLEDAFVDMKVYLPCGRCIGCRLEHARQWAARCYHESTLHDVSLFVTLTYDEEHLPDDGSLEPQHMTDFLKRLRHWYSYMELNPRTNRMRRRYRTLRYFQCGEYGDRTLRPHHHALLFGLELPDLAYWNGKLKTSKILDSLWGHGQCWVGNVQLESAGYVARYAMKKVYGEPAHEHYGERCPEYVTMSRKPGIGEGWIRKYWRDIYPLDRMVLKGSVMKPPRFYDDWVFKHVPGGDAIIRSVRRERMAAAMADPHKRGHFLGMAEFVKSEQIKALSRKEF